ncbi:TetR family transcriptional regulator [Burkholderia sp. Leaf177]|nr:TetR family transcriptional regulator [Burkholderia sp. Leaf177]
MNDSVDAAVSKGRGRPRAFDRQIALTRAMDTFWLKGFDGCAISDLTTAMNINSPSLYAAFGSKEDLFREALDLYGALEGDATQRALSGPRNIRDALGAMLKRSVEMFTRGPQPRGCMVMLGAMNVSADQKSLRTLLHKRQKQILDLIRKRMAMAVDDGEFAVSADIDGLSTLCAVLFTGLAVHAHDGAGRAKLNSAIDAFLATLPVQEKPAG